MTRPSEMDRPDATFSEWQSGVWVDGNRDLRLDERLEGRTVFVVLPAYNEEEGLEKLLLRIDRICRAFGIAGRIVIVNDGSVDRTRAVIRSFDDIAATLLDYPVNRGIAAVFKSGFAWVLERASDRDFVITLDADNTHSPYVMLDLLRRLLDGDELVIASRFQPGGGMVAVPTYRRVLSLAVSALLRRLAKLPNVRDYSTFYRGYQVGLLRRGFHQYGDALIEGEGFSAMATLLIRLATLSTRISEVPLLVRYDLKEGGSGLPILRTSMGYFRLMLRLPQMRAARPTP